MPPFTPEPTLCELCLIIVLGFLEVRLVLLRRVCGFLFFLDDLQAFDLLEGEAHDAAVLALVLEVDGLVVVVDEDLRRNPAAVVEPLCPLRDVFVLYPLGLLAHPRLLLPSIVFLYPKEALCILQRRFGGLIHPNAWNRYSRKFISKILYSPAPIPLQSPPAGAPFGPAPLELVTPMYRYAGLLILP